MDYAIRLGRDKLDMIPGDTHLPRHGKPLQGSSSASTIAIGLRLWLRLRRSLCEVSRSPGVGRPHHFLQQHLVDV